MGSNLEDEGTFVLPEERQYCIKLEATKKASTNAGQTIEVTPDIKELENLEKTARAKLAYSLRLVFKEEGSLQVLPNVGLEQECTAFKDAIEAASPGRHDKAAAKRDFYIQALSQPTHFRSFSRPTQTAVHFAAATEESATKVATAALGEAASGNDASLTTIDAFHKHPIANRGNGTSSPVAYDDEYAALVDSEKLRLISESKISIEFHHAEPLNRNQFCHVFSVAQRESLTASVIESVKLERRFNEVEKALRAQVRGEVAEIARKRVAEEAARRAAEEELALSRPRKVEDEILEKPKAAETAGSANKGKKK
eukprot:Clim_evm33s210 gene=Clim_evmTU33s210